MDRIKKLIFVGRELYIKCRNHPVTVNVVDDTAFIVEDKDGRMTDFTFEDIGREIFLSKDYQSCTFKNPIEYLEYITSKDSEVSDKRRTGIDENEKTCEKCIFYNKDCWGEKQVCSRFEYRYNPSPEEKARWKDANTGPYAGPYDYYNSH